MLRQPEWLKVKAASPEKIEFVEKILQQEKLETVCENANCPNIFECFSKQTATFMILGNICTRNCRFCAVNNGKPGPVNLEEPDHLASAVKRLGLDYVVMTSVTRDDLPDGGAEHFAECVKAIRKFNHNVLIEALIPDLKGSIDALNVIANASPNVINHNIETVPRLYHVARQDANYHRSLIIIKNAKILNPSIITKSGIMLGLGETKEEILSTMRQIRSAGCDILTLGQYLSPSKQHLKIERYVEPDEFEQLKQEGLKMGFSTISAGPLVRSSYKAKDFFYKASAIQ
ncbi:MAG: lipoyl synthase [Bacillota bacterium]